MKAKMNGSQPFLVEIITVAYMQTNLMGGYPFVGPAFDTGFAEAARTYPHINFTQRVLKSDSASKSCPEWGMVSDNRLAEFYYKRPAINANLTVFLSAGCSGDLPGVVQFATGLNKLVMSTGATLEYIFDKTHFPTFLTVNHSSKSMTVTIYQRLIRMFSWTSVMILADTTSNLGYTAAARTIRSVLLRDTSAMDYTEKNISSAIQMDPVFARFKISSRVMLLFAEPFPVRNFLLQAINHNITAGSYVFITYYPVPSYGKVTQYSYVYGDESDELIRKAFRVCLFLELDMPKVQSSYTTTWKALSKSKYNYSYDDAEEVSPTVAASYAATAIVSQVVNEVQKRSPVFDWNDGAKFATEFFNRTCATNVGPITLSSVGERLTMLKFNYYNYERAAFLTALEQSSNLYEKLRLTETPTWPGPWPVPNQPKCGFRGDRMECRITGNLIPSSVGGSVSCIVLICSVASYLAKRYFAGYGDWWMLDSGNFSTIRRTSLFHAVESNWKREGIRRPSYMPRSDTLCS